MPPSNGYVVYLEPIKQGVPNPREVPVPACRTMPSTTEMRLADVDKRITFRAIDNDEYGCKLSIRNVAQGESIIYKIKTTSPDRYRVRPSLALIEPGGCAKIPINSQAGVSPSEMLQDRFQVQVCVCPRDMMSDDNDGCDYDCESIHNSHLADLSDIFKRLLIVPGIPTETYRVTVTVEPRMGASSGRDLNAKAGIRPSRSVRYEHEDNYDLEERNPESVYKKLDRIHMLTSIIIIILGMCIAFAIVWFMQGMGELSESDCRTMCPTFIPVSECDGVGSCRGGIGGLFGN